MSINFKKGWIILLFFSLLKQLHMIKKFGSNNTLMYVMKKLRMEGYVFL